MQSVSGIERPVYANGIQNGWDACERESKAMESSRERRPGLSQDGRCSREQLDGLEERLRRRPGPLADSSRTSRPLGWAYGR